MAATPFVAYACCAQMLTRSKAITRTQRLHRSRLWGAFTTVCLALRYQPANAKSNIAARTGNRRLQKLWQNNNSLPKYVPNFISTIFAKTSKTMF